MSGDTKWLDEAPDASWLDDAPDAVAPRPHAGMGDVQAAPSSHVGTGAVPAGLLTGDPATDAQIAQSLAGQGHRKDITGSDVAHAGLIAASMLAPEAIPGAVLGGAVGGGLYGLGTTKAKDAAGAALSAGGGALAGATVAKFLPMAFKAVMGVPRALGRLVLPRIHPTDAAKALQAEGIPLTIGQMAPESAIGRIEEVSTHNPMGMQEIREANKDVWRNVAMNRGAAPGAAPPTTGDAQQRMSELYKGFRPAYDAIRGLPVPGEAVQDMARASTRLPQGVDARTREGVRAEIENALTVLPRGYAPERAAMAHHHGAPAPTVPSYGPSASEFQAPSYAAAPPMPAEPPAPLTAGDLMKVRENIRAEIQAARKAQDFDRLRLLGHAEDAVTSTLEENLPAEAAEALRNTDRQYAKLMTIEGAAPIGRSEFSPYQLSKAVERSAGRRAFKQGKAGDLQDLAEAGGKVFDTKVPLTGMRGVVLSGVPKWAAAPIARAANLPTLRSIMLGEQLPPLTSVPVPTTLRSPLAALADAIRRSAALKLAPAMAEGEPQQ